MTDQRIAIIGLGLIGGSMGLALKRSATPPTIIGWDRDSQVGEQALVRGAIDRFVEDIQEAGTANIVIVAVPVLAVEDIFRSIASTVSAQTIVTDVASTKSAVCEWATALPCMFVGGHPMAGSERHGIAAARADLFDGATYCLTPTVTTPKGALDELTALVQSIGARPYILDAAAHDRAVAAVSHLPFILSSALVDVASASSEWAQLRTIAATGFRDVSRLASGDPRMHRDICLSNEAQIRPWLLQTARALEEIAESLGNPERMQQWFDQTKAVRDDMYKQRDPDDQRSNT